MPKVVNRWLTTRQVAEALSVSPRTVSKWIRDGTLPAMKLNASTWRIKEADLIDFTEGRTEEP